MDAYKALREELGRPPLPIDTWGRVPSFRDYRAAFRTWHDLRIELKDAEPWERNLERGGLEFELLRKADADWQEARVTAYAALWGTMQIRDDIAAGYELFFTAHPQWKVERREMTRESLLQRLEASLSPLFKGGQWVSRLDAALSEAPLRKAVQDRLLFTVASDFKLRHGGVLRRPEELRLFASYTRSEVVNYFGEQYDPQRHNLGVLKLPGNNYVLMTKIDTNGAKEQFQYTNHLLASEGRFVWSSQNQMRRENEKGREITEHVARGNALHLFVSPSSHQPATYLGRVTFVSAEGDGPMKVTFQLPEALPDGVREHLS